MPLHGSDPIVDNHGNLDINTHDCPDCFGFKMIYLDSLRAERVIVQALHLGS